MLVESSNKQWLSIGFGKIRRKARQDEPKAVERTLKNGEKTYAIEYKCLGGTLEGIRFKDDERYGKSWTLFITDDDGEYAVQISENTRYASDLLKRIPLLEKGEYYKIAPYDFEQNGKRKQGLSIKTIDDERVESYYEKFTEEPDGWKIDYLHGLPKYTGDPEDKDELKIYFLQVTKFLRTAALEHISSFNVPGHTEERAEDGPTDDIPFDENVPMENEDDIPF